MIKLDSIYNEDCMDGLDRVDNRSIDLILTDPPYCIGASSNGVKSSYTDFSLIIPFFEKLFGHFRRTLKPDGCGYLFTDWRTYPLLYPLLCRYFNVENTLIWSFGYPKTGVYYRFSYEMIIFFRGVDYKREFYAGEMDVLQIAPSKEAAICNRMHKSQKPENVITKLILDGSQEGDVILDPFIGSGTTAAVALNNGRHFIGFELDKKYFDMAEQRIQTKQPSIEEYLR